MDSGKNVDPRLNEGYVRRISGPGSLGDVVLVGVVHDHPSSKYRVKAIVESTEFEALALELPPLAVPLFERYAEDTRTPPVFGGEMSAAIQASSADRIVGIDGPSIGFLAHFLRNVCGNDHPVEMVRSVASGLVAATKCAIVCRVAAGIAALTSIRLEVDSPVAHAVGWDDDPLEQAADEDRQIKQVQAVANAFGTPRSSRFRDSTREAHMVDRLATLRRSGSVVAVVGLGHLDPLASSLELRRPS